MRRAFVALLTGSAIGQFAQFAATPALARLYGTDAFSLAAFYTSIGTAVIPIAALRFDVVALAEPDLARARRVIRAARILVLLTALPFALAAAFAHGATGAALLAAAGAIGIGGYTVLAAAERMREGAFTRLSRQKIATAVAMLPVQAALAGAFPSFGLIAGDLFGKFAGMVAVGRVGAATPTTSQEHGAALLHRHGLAAGALCVAYGLNTIGFVIPNALLYRSLSGVDYASYAMCERMVHGATTLVGQCLYTILLANAATLFLSDPAALRRLLARIVAWLAPPAFALFAALMFLGPLLFAKFLGQRWSAAGDLSRSLSLYYAVSFVFWPFNAILPAIGLRRDQVVLDGTRACVAIAATAGCLAVNASPTACFAALSAVHGTAYIVNFLLCLHRIARRMRTKDAPCSIAFVV